MDKTDRVLKQFGKPTNETVIPIGDNIIIPNLSGITGNKDAMNKLTLQQITDNGATTSNAITITNATNAIIGDTSNQKLILSNSNGSVLRWNTSNDVVVGNGAISLQAGGQIACRMSSGGVSILKGAVNPVASAALEISSTTKGFLPSRMDTTAKNAISSPATGLVVYDTTLNKLCVYTGSAWETITSL